ncbi:MAG: fatty acyl-AMP ligase [Acidobacteriota bacterium]
MTTAPTTLAALLDHAAGDAPRDDVGLRFVDRRERDTPLDFFTLRREARTIAARLVASGVEPGDRVALLFATEPDFFRAFFGVVLLGAVPVPLYPPVRLGRLDEYHKRTATMLDAAGCRMVLAAPRIRRLLGETMARARVPLGLHRLDELPTNVESFEPTTVSADDLALIQFSSGTTVDPKPVALEHRALLSQGEVILGSFPPPLGSRHSGVSWLPLYHDMGLIGCVLPALFAGSELTLIPPELFVARPAIWLRTLSRRRATVSVAPNFAYGLCADRIRDDQLDGVDLSGWQVALNGAEPISPAVLKRFTRRFAPYGLREDAITPVYGLSEAALAVTFDRLDAPFVSRAFDREALSRHGIAKHRSDGIELVSVGRPLPGFLVAIRDAEQRTLATERIGHVWVRGPSLMRGYFDRPDATADVLRDGWLDTGDLGFLDQDNRLFLTGRAKDVIILRGRNHAPADIEQAVDEVVGVRRGCVVAVSHHPEHAEHERLWLFVEYRADSSTEARQALPALCREAVLTRTGLRADDVWLLAPGTLPRTSSGKLRRATTLQRHLDGSLEPPTAVTPLYLASQLARSAWVSRFGRGRE